jgi:phosphinothricin acetyltransferase
MESNSQSGLEIRAAAVSDAALVANIYNHYVKETVITFEEEPVATAEMVRRIEEATSASLPWLVAKQGHMVVGYACATPWKNRSAYRFSTEITVYLAPAHTRRGIGTQLYAELFSVLRANGIHAVMGCIALPNDASIALHEKLGLKKVAHFHQVGFKFDRWVDVGYWQRIL